jgi:hypothetical protein
MSLSATCRTLTAVAVVVTSAGCGERSTPLVTVTDSAGVRLTISRPTQDVFAVVDTTPEVSIGGAEAEGPGQFSLIRGIHVGSEGRIWVADGLSAELRIFHADGSHWKTRGGRGEGPGEFQRIRLLGPFGGDSVAVSDDALGRMTVFDAQAEMVRTARYIAGDVPIPRTHDVFPDGSLLGQTPRLLSASSMQAGQLLFDTARLVRLDLGGREVTPMAEAPGPLWLWTGRSQIPLPFTANPGLDVEGGLLHLVAGPYFRVRVFDSGAVTEVYGVSRQPQAVGESDIEGYRAMTEEWVPEPQRTEFLAVLDHPARPDVLPAYSNVVTTSTGHIWVQRFAPDHVWEVYGPDRSWVGRVEMPEGFIPSVIAGTGLVGVWRDDLHVEHVRVYRMTPARDATTR